MVVVRPYGDERVKGAIYNASLLLGGDGLDDVALDDRRLLGGLEGARRVLRRRGAFLLAAFEAVAPGTQEATATCADQASRRRRGDGVSPRDRGAK